MVFFRESNEELHDPGVNVDGSKPTLRFKSVWMRTVSCVATSSIQWSEGFLFCVLRDHWRYRGSGDDRAVMKQIKVELCT